MQLRTGIRDILVGETVLYPTFSKQGIGEIMEVVQSVTLSESNLLPRDCYHDVHFFAKHPSDLKPFCFILNGRLVDVPSIAKSS